MLTVNRSAPIFPVANLERAIDHYRRLGFAVEPYGGGGYAFANRDGVELHLTAVCGLDPKTTTSATYLWVSDSDALAAEWVAAGAHVHMPHDTEWGQHEGSHVDPDGNLIRFGTPKTGP